MNQGNDPLNEMLNLSRRLGRRPKVPTVSSMLPREVRQLSTAAAPLLQHREAGGPGSGPADTRENGAGEAWPAPAATAVLEIDGLSAPAAPLVPSQAARERRARLTVCGLLMVLGGLAVAGAAFLPLTRGTIGFAGQLRGLDHRLQWYFSGWPMLGAGVLLVVLGVVGAVAARAVWAFVTGLVVAVLAGFLAGYLIVREAAGLSDLIREATGIGATGTPGVGLWLAVFGAAWCVIAGVAGWYAGSARR